MLGKINKHSLVQGFHKAKQFIGHAYGKTKNFLNDVDYGVRLLKKVYGAVSPILDQYGDNGVNKHVMKAINGYDNIRHRILDSHDEISDHLHKIRCKLNKNKVKFNLV